MSPVSQAHTWSFILMLVYTLYLAVIIDARSDRLIVQTDKGRVMGIRHHMPSLPQPVDAFLGIPFAKPPVGGLRFKHPQPIDRWEGTYNATSLPKSCYQNDDTFFGPFKGTQMWNVKTAISEDCLYLNVWIPAGKRPRNSAVLVWIHPGGFFSGSSTLDVYDGQVLAAMNDIIVVSIAYRVGALGFLYLGHPSAPGNAGMFDQLMALDWVQRNIRYFGGNPGNVTLFGSGAGAASVGIHLLSPLSRHMFQQAIMQSGSANMMTSTLTPEEAKSRSLELAIDYLECNGRGANGTQQIIECMNYISAQKITNEQWVSRGIMQNPFVPVVDGMFLSEDPMISLQRGDFKKCPILMGSNLNEGTYYMMYELTESLSLQKYKMTKQEFDRGMGQLFGYYPQYPYRNNRFGMQAIQYQYSNPIDPEDQRTNLENLESAIGDCYLTCDVNAFQHHYASASQNVYAYQFTHRYSSNPWPEWMGVLHRDEIMFVFGEPCKQANSLFNFTTEEEDLSKQIMTYWANFAKTGDPSQVAGRESNREWPKYTSKEREYLELSLELLQEDKSAAIKKGLRVKECAFWKEYLPGLVKNTKKMNSLTDCKKDFEASQADAS